MIPIIISSAAYEDLQEIWAYIGIENGNLDAADSLLHSIRDTIALLPRFPNRGTKCPEFDLYVTGVRRIMISGHTIYYRVTDSGVFVGRIVHDRRHREQAMRRWFHGL